jgi:hypothetical protein
MIKAGQTISIAGTVRALPSNLDEVRDAWGLTGDAMTAVSRERIYLSANDLETTGS